MISGLSVLFFLTLIHTYQNRQLALRNEKQHIRTEKQHISTVSKESALRLDSRLADLVSLGLTLASVPILGDAVVKSNARFEAMPRSEYEKKLLTDNQRWKDADGSKSPFVQSRLTNPSAQFLKQQQAIIKGFYGEIFLTNRHGVMISSTGKLTTLNHAHKYWWKGAYNNGKGRIYLDDRGFDVSSGGYVLGVVVPVKRRGQVIGILKCNIKLINLISDQFQHHETDHSIKVMVVRSNGGIIIGNNSVPLSDTLSGEVIPYLQPGKPEVIMETINQKKSLVAITPVIHTTGLPGIGFGGSQQSVDHIKGGSGDAWYIVSILDTEAAVKEAGASTSFLFYEGVILVTILSLIALILGKWIAKPLNYLAYSAEKIGSGQLGTRVHIDVKDEIGILAIAFNNMAENLEKTLISKNELIQEVELRKQAETRIQANLAAKEILISEVHHRVKNNLTTVSSLLKLQGQRVADDETRQILLDSQNRVHTMASVHEILCRSENPSVIDMQVYLSQLGRMILKGFQVDDRISLVVQAQKMMIKSKQAAPIGLAVNELMTNSLKYAFPDNQKGEITVALKLEHETRAVLVVADNGVGIPEALNTQEPAGLGLKLVKVIAENQLDGTITVSKESGTHFTISFELDKL